MGSCTLNRKRAIQKDRQKMDQVDKMKLTKYGFRFNLLRSSSFLSVLGIVVSVIGIIGSIACFVMGSIFGSGRSGRELGGFPWSYFTLLELSFSSSRSHTSPCGFSSRS